MAAKSCRKCGAVLPLTEFYRHPMMADGHLHACKACHRSAVAKRYYDNHTEHLARDKARNTRPERKAQLRASNRRNAHRRRKENWAKGVVAHAIADGRLVAQPCERCGALPSNGHHEDYGRPLDVVWLCSLHHAARHREIRREGKDLNRSL